MATIFEDNFNSYNNGDLNGQGDWSGSANWDVQGTIVKEGAKAVQCSVNASGINKHGTAQTAGLITIYFQRNSVATGLCAIYIHRATDGAASLVIYIGSGAGGSDTVEIYLGAVLTELAGTFIADTWNYVQIQFAADDTWRANLNGGTWSNWGAPYGGRTWAASGGLDEIQISHNAGTGSISYFDYIAENPLAVDETVYPSALGLTTSQPSPTQNYDYQLSVSALGLALSQQTPTFAISITVFLSALGLEIGLPNPTLNYDYSLEVSALGLVLGQPTPTPNYDYQLSVLALGLILSQQTPTIPFPADAQYGLIKGKGISYPSGKSKDYPKGKGVSYPPPKSIY